MTNNYRGGSYRRPILPPQRETKQYTPMSEVGIPAIQAAIVVWLCDILAGLLLYIAIYIGPITISSGLGLIILSVTAGVVGFARISYQAKAPAILIGVLMLAAQQYAFVKLAAIWPWHWREPLQMWHNWVHTLWLGPLVGGGVLIWRFIHEVLDPFWPRIPMYPEEPKRRQLPVYDRKVFVTKHVNDKSAAVEEEPVVEEVWIPPEREIPLKGHLIAFLQACDKRGTSRADWLPKGEKYHLNTGLMVTRGVYDDLMRVLRGIGIYRRVGGTGTGLERLYKLQEAIDLIEEKVDE